MRSFLAILFAALLLPVFAGCGGGSGLNTTSQLVAVTGGGSTGASTAALRGPYAFLVTGYDSFGNPLAIAGSFTSAGNGTITSGRVDLNDGTAIESFHTITGSYTSAVNFRGNITLTDVSGFSFAFAFSMKSDGSFGALVSLDFNYYVAAGTMYRQNTSAFSAAPAGSFVYEADSRSPHQISSVGLLQISGGGVVSGAADVSVAGAAGGAPATAPFTLSGQFQPPSSSTGRGAATISISSGGQPSGFGSNFIYYIISSTQFIAIEDDTSANGTVGSIVANAQTSVPDPQSGDVLPGSVFSITGLDNVAGLTISAIGTLAAPGGSTANLVWDSNDAGTIFGGTTPVTSSNQTFSYDATTGRGTITISTTSGGSGGAANGLFDSAVFYLSAPGTGVLLETTNSTSNAAFAGPFVLQTGAGSFGPNSLSASMIGVGTAGDSNSSSDAAGEDLILAATSGDGANGSIITGFLDQTFLGGLENPNLAFEFQLTSNIDPATGRGTMVVPGSGTIPSTPYVFYMVGNNQFVFISIASGFPSHYYTMTPQ